MSEKPPKRLVGKLEYMGILCAKGTNTAVSGAFMIAGAVLALGALVAFLFVGDYGIWSLLTGGVLGLLGYACVRISEDINQDSRQMERVALLTKHNTGELPEVESLVRASDVPASQQQTELLRAAQHGKVTPPEELLRASTNRQGD